MKKLPLILILILLLSAVNVFAQTGTTRRLSVAAGAGRSASFREKRFERRQFNLSLVFSYKLSPRVFANFSIVENFNFKTPNYRTGFSFKIY